MSTAVVYPIIIQGESFALFLVPKSVALRKKRSRAKKNDTSKCRTNHDLSVLMVFVFNKKKIESLLVTAEPFVHSRACG